MRFSFGDFFAHVSTDIWKIWLDLPDGIWDRLHHIIERHIPLPAGISGRRIAVGIALAARSLIAQQRGPAGHLGQFLREITDDGIVELAKRVIEQGMVGRNTPIHVVPVAAYSLPYTATPPSDSRSKQYTEAIEHLIATLFPWMK